MLAQISSYTKHRNSRLQSFLKEISFPPDCSLHHHLCIGYKRRILETSPSSRLALTTKFHNDIAATSLLLAFIFAAPNFAAEMKCPYEPGASEILGHYDARYYGGQPVLIRGTRGQITLPN